MKIQPFLDILALLLLPVQDTEGMFPPRWTPNNSTIVR